MQVPSSVLVLALFLSAPPTDLETYIQLLGCDDYHRRESATSQLLQLSSVPESLYAARKSSNLELQRRASRIIKIIEKRMFKAAIQKLESRLADGRFDLIPDFQLYWAKNDSQLLGFQLISKACAKLVNRPQVIESPIDKNASSSSRFLIDPFPFQQNHPQLLWSVKNEAITMPDGLMLVSAKKIVSPKEVYAIGVFSVSDGFESKGNLSQTCLISNGDVTLHSAAFRCVMICDGTITLAGSANRCVVIARNIQVSGAAVGSTFASSNTIKQGMFIKPGANRLYPNSKHPLGLVRFFEVADVGLTLEGLKVTKVTGPLATAGMKPGDVFTHVDGVAVADGEALRKALRRRYAILGYGAFQVQRDGKPLTFVAELDE